MGKKKKVPQINGTSSADIAFMLLLFFLLTTSMDTDTGLARRLPPPPDKSMKTEQDIKVNKRNILQVMVNTYNQVLCGSEYIDVKQLRERAKIFLKNEARDANLPEYEEKDVPFFGTMIVLSEKHVISLQNDRGTSYQAYIDVQNELVAAYNELRNEVSRTKWGKGFDDLNEDQQKAIQMIYPQKISEAEPKNYGDKK
jgi:biopolymer transport protein ExbD